MTLAELEALVLDMNERLRAMEAAAARSLGLPVRAQENTSWDTWKRAADQRSRG